MNLLTSMGILFVLGYVAWTLFSLAVQLTGRLAGLFLKVGVGLLAFAACCWVYEHVMVSVVA